MKKSYKNRFKLDKKNSFQVMMMKDTNKIIRGQFLQTRLFPYKFQGQCISQIRFLKPLYRL